MPCSLNDGTPEGSVSHRNHLGSSVFALFESVAPGFADGPSDEGAVGLADAGSVAAGRVLSKTNGIS